MKLKVIIIGLLLITPVFICSGQWVGSEPEPTGVFRAVKFKNQSDGLILGHEGIVMKTGDQGESWTLLHNDLEVDFFDFQFINDTLIYAYCADMIYISTDFGTSWTEKSGLPANARMAYFVDPDTGFAGDNIYGLRRTDDGGSTWYTIWDHPADNVTYCELNAIDFLNDSTGFACGRGLVVGGGGFSFIIKTVDRGLNWSDVFGSTQAYDVRHPLDIQVIDDSTVIAIDDDFDLLRSDDSGETWYVVSFVNPDPETWFGMTASSMFAISPDTILINAETTVWLLKSRCNSKRKILRTTDGGQNWIVQFFEAGEFQECSVPLLSDITFINDTVGISVGYNLILRTVNIGGNTHIPDTVIFGSIEDWSWDPSGLLIYPNPTSGYLTIELNTTDYEILDVFTMSGLRIKTVLLNSYNSIDLAPFSSGLYILKFSGMKTCYHPIIITQ